MNACLPPSFNVGQTRQIPLSLSTIAKLYQANKSSNSFARMLLEKRAEEWGWLQFQKTGQLAGKVQTFDTPLAYIRFVCDEVEKLAKTSLSEFAEKLEAVYSDFMHMLEKAAPQVIEKVIREQQFPSNWYSRLDTEKTLRNWIDHSSLDLLKALASIDRENVIFQVLGSQPSKTFLRLPPYAKAASELLNQAFTAGHVPLARLLLRWGALVDYRFENGCVILPQMHLSAFESLKKLLKDSRQLPEHCAIRQGKKELLPEGKIPCDAAGWTALHYAAAGEQYELASLLLDRDPDSRMSVDKEGKTPTDIAASCLNMELFDLLSGLGAIRAEQLKTFERAVENDATLLTTPDSDGMLPLHIAVVLGERDRVQWISEHFPERLKDKVHNVYTAAYLAAAKGKLDVLQIMIAKDPSLLKIPCHQGLLPLNAAVLQSNEAVVQWIAEHYPERLKDRMPNGRTAAHMAAALGNLEMLQILIAKDVSLLDRLDIKGLLPLHHAAQGGHKHVVQWISEQHAERLKDKTLKGLTAAHIAAAHGKLDVLQLLIGKDLSLLGTSDKSGNRPLHCAAQEGHIPVVQWIADHYPKRLKDSTDGKTAAHTAAAHGQLDVLQLLNEKDASLLSTPTKAGLYPLHGAIAQRRLNVVRWTAEHCPDRLKDKSENLITSAHVAALFGQLDVLQLLASKDASMLATPDNKGLRPLHYAAQKGHTSVVQWMVEHHSDRLKDRTTEGKTAAYMAAEQGKMEVLQLFRTKDESHFTITDNQGWLPHRIAEHNGHKEVAQWIFKPYSDAAKRNEPARHQVEAELEVKDTTHAVHSRKRRISDAAPSPFHPKIRKSAVADDETMETVDEDQTDTIDFS